MARRKAAQTISQGIWDLQGLSLPYRVVVELRSNVRYALTNQQAILRVPYHLPAAELNEHLKKFYNWVVETRAQKPIPPRETSRLQDLAQGQHWQFGRYIFRIAELQSIAGARATLSVVSKLNVPDLLLQQDGPLQLDIKLKIPEEARGAAADDLIQRLFFKQLSSLAFPYVQRLVREVDQEHFNVWNGQLKLSYMSSRWGSCSGKGNISLSTKLLAAPEDVLRAVIVHELAHVLQHNHSKAFWDIVYRVMPDYAEADRWLRQESSKMVWLRQDS